MKGLANLANIATIISLLVGAVAMVFQIFEWSKLTPEIISQSPWFNSIRRSLPFIITAAIFFWIGTVYYQSLLSKNFSLSQPAPVISVTSTPKTHPSTSQSVFFDDFKSGFRPEWQTVSGTWIRNDGVPFLRTGDDGIVVVGNSDWDNFALDVDMLESHNGGIIFAYKMVNDEPRYSGIFFISGFIDLFILGENGNSNFSPSTMRRLFELKNNKTPYQIHLEIQGDAIRLFINDEKIYNFEGLNQSLAGPVGIINREFEKNLLFENFSVSELELP